MQLFKNILWTLYTTLLCPFHAQKALFKVSKICNINFWIENDPTPLWNFSENSSVLVPSPSLSQQTQHGNELILTFGWSMSHTGGVEEVDWKSLKTKNKPGLQIHCFLDNSIYFYRTKVQSNQFPPPIFWVRRRTCLGPIIVYACQQLTDELVENWMSWPK